MTQGTRGIIKAVAARALRTRSSHLFIALAAFGVLILIKDPGYYSVNNLRVVGLNASAEAIGAVGTAFLMIAGGIDLSISSIFLAAGFCSAGLANHTPAVVAIVGGIVFSAAVGAINGILVWRIRVSPLIVTLGSLTLIAGVVEVVTQGEDVIPSGQTFLNFGQSSPLGVPTLVWAAVVLAVASGIVLSKTTIGSHIYAIGGNREASELAGVRVRRLVLGLFVFAGTTAGLAGIMTTARFAVADITFGTNYNLDVITAVLLGGVAFTGGEGTIGGVMMGVVFLNVIQSGIIALGINPYYSDAISGAALVVSVGLEQLTKERNARLRRSIALAEMAALEADSVVTQAQRSTT